MSTATLIRISGAIIVFAVFLSLAVTLAVFAGGPVEAALFPIAKATHIAGSVQRNLSTLCWSTHLEKWRMASPAYFEYFIGVSTPDGGQDVITTAPYRLDEHGARRYLSRSGFVEPHPAGMKWDTRYCLEVPQGIGPSQSFIVEGRGFFDVWHGLWRVPIELPSFQVPAN